MYLYAYGKVLEVNLKTIPANRVSSLVWWNFIWRVIFEDAWL